MTVKRPARAPVFALVAAAALQAAAALALDTDGRALTVTEMAAGLDEPWSVAFLPDGGFLVTERDGRLTRYPAGGGDGRSLSGLPEVYAEGQGGLFDVLVPRDFAATGEVLLSYAAPVNGGGATAFGTGRLGSAGIEGFRMLWRMPEADGSGRHFGGRLVEAADGTIFLTIGDRGTGPDGQEARDLARHEGKVVRLNRDGTIPGDNPFADGPAPAIWSSGHRNPQGATLDAQGRLWVNAHGAQGGDEVDLVEKAADYGWPAASYGVDYGGGAIGQGTEVAGTVQPVHYWDPSIAPSGHMIYSGRLWPDWAGDHFAGSLKFDYIARLDPDTPGGLPGVGGWAETRIGGPETARVRDVREAPDGSIWFVSVGNGAVYRITP
jgi:glucose/arabinose dehydrogenase